MKFIDLDAQYQKIRPQIDQAIQTVLQHGQFILGPEVRKAEALLANYVGVKHCVTTSSGTSALQVALMALNVGPGDEVITTPFSFFATVEVILLLGATPVFVDIDPKTYNIDPMLLEQAISTKTKAIIPVDLYGQCADYDAINAIAQHYHIPVVEDAAQSFGSSYKGRRAGSLAKIACTSFFPAKPLGCYGDGGACFTEDDQLAQAMAMIMNHGQKQRYEHLMVGINARFDTLQAAIIIEKLQKQFDQEVSARQQVARWYEDYLGSHISLPYIEPHNQSVYAQYTIRVKDRERLVAELSAQGIPTAIHYPKPLHHQAALSEAYRLQSFPQAELAAKQVLSLPFHPYLQEASVKKIANALIEINQVACVL